MQDCGLGEEAPPQPSKQRTFSTSAVLGGSLEPALDTEAGPATPDPGHTAASTEGEPRLASGAQVDSALRAKEEGMQKLSPLKVSTKYCAIQYLSTCPKLRCLFLFIIKPAQTGSLVSKAPARQ